MIYEGADLPAEHDIQVTVDGELLLMANGKERVEFLATPRGEPKESQKPLHHIPDHSALERATYGAKPASSKKASRPTVTWPDCKHSIRTDSPPQCPYCTIDKIKEKPSSAVNQRVYQQGYAAGRERYIYIKNRHDRIAQVLSDIANDRVDDPLSAARQALDREAKNRRGGVLQQDGENCAHHPV